MTNISDNEINKIFARRLKYYLNMYDMSQKDLADKLSVSPTTVSNWALGIKSPRMGKVDAMCKIFNCKRSDLIEDKPTEVFIPTNYDIAIDLENTLDKLSSDHTLMFNGLDLNDDSRRLLKNSLEMAIENAKILSERNKGNDDK